MTIPGSKSRVPFQPDDPEIRRLARGLLSNLGGGGDTESLVHEAYLRLVDRSVPRDPSWRKARAYIAMKHHLADKGRRSAVAGHHHQRQVDEGIVREGNEDAAVLELKEVLQRLFAREKNGSLFHELIRLRLEGVQSARELAERTGVPERTISRKLVYMRCRLEAHLLMAGENEEGEEDV